MRCLRYIADYWWIPALILVGVGLSLFGRRVIDSVFGMGLGEKLNLEMTAIGAKREVREVKLQQGHDAAVKFVKVKYGQKLDALNEQERARAEELETDPAKLAQAMARLGCAK